MKTIQKFMFIFSLAFLSLIISSCVISKVNYSLNLTADKNEACAGEIVKFKTELIGDQVKVDINYEITEGSSYATITQEGVLTINDDATPGSVIKVKSRAQEVVSNEVTITVGTKLLEIVASTNKTEIIVGQNAELVAQLVPANAKVEKVEWVITEGSEACSIASNLLVVKENAAVDTVIKVKAVSGNVESNELEFKVISGKSEKLLLSLSNSSLTVDKFSSSPVILEATIYDAEYNEVADQIVDYEVIEGAEFLAVNYENNVCSFEALGHGTAIVKATIRGTSYSKTATVKVLVPPTAIKLHEVFTQRLGYVYNFSNKDTLKFPVEILGENVCQDYNLLFTDSLGNVGSNVATFDKETGEITFNTTGRVNVIVTSASGSKNETSASYTFNINEGINVYTFEELKATLESSDYNGQIINIVVLEKPTTDAYSYEYGYDLVPLFALNAKEDQTLDNILGNKEDTNRIGEGSIKVYNKNVYINGNQHEIDASQVRMFTLDETTKEGRPLNREKGIDPILYVGFSKNNLQIDVKIYDLSFVGNSSINHAGEIHNKHAVGTYTRGLHIGDEAYLSSVYLDIQNISLSSFDNGMRIYHVVNNGLAKNIQVSNIFGNGVESYANQITFEDMNYGLCGGAGIEICPGSYECSADKAGTTFTEKQNVIFAGSITTTNFTTGDTKYLNSFSAMGYTVMQILNGVLTYYDKDVIANLMNEEGQFAFVAFVFNDISNLPNIVENKSNYDYKNIDGAGIVNINEFTADDTTHKYVEIDVIVEFAGTKVSIGKVLTYNFNYQA